MRRLFTFLLAMTFASTCLFAQMANPQEPLTNDPSIRTGKLANGLTYYIKHNTKPEKRAEFYLFTAVGAIQENERQAGLAHFLEHMALNGTKNLPGKTIISYLESIGCSFGLNINAGTGVEQTSYMLNNVPMTRTSILDTCLLIMHDYAAFVTNDPEEIDKERGVIIEELRTRRNAQWRTFEGSLPYLYKGSKYATCNLIGTVEGIESFPAEELQDFYKTWYRPDHQAVIVVGDVDVDYVEKKLTALFADVPAPTTPSPKKTILIPENDDPIVGIITDPETTNSSIEFLIKSEPIPTEMRPLGMIFMVDMVKSLIVEMLNARYGEIAQQPNAPFITASGYFTSITTSCDAAYFSTAFKDGEGLSAFEALLMEIEKMKRFGFTQPELDRAKANMLRIFERNAQNANDRQNNEFINGIINNFFLNAPVMDPAYELEVAKGYMPFITLDVINQSAASFITPENHVILFASPQRPDLAVPTEAELLAVAAKVENATLEAYQEETLDEPIVDPALLTGGKVVSQNTAAFESTEWVLSNGVKVLVKPTQLKQDEVIIESWSEGGLSVMPEEWVPSLESNVYSLWIQSSGVGPYNATNLKKKLTGKLLSVTPSIHSYTQGISASGSIQDMETMMELIYAFMVTPRFEASEFEAPMAQLRSVVPNMETQPVYKFQQELYKSIFNNSPRRQLISTQMLEKVSLENLEKGYRQAFGSADGTTFVIVGNVDMETLKPLVEKYLGSLPVTGTKRAWKDDNTSTPKGKIDNHFQVTMETPKTSVAHAYSADLPYTLENYLYLNTFSSILNMIYTKTLREEEGGTYGAGVQPISSNRPKEQSILLVSFDTDPAKKTSMCQVAINDVKQLDKEGPSDEYLNKAKENFLKQHQEDVINNYYWANALEVYYLDNMDLITSYEDVVKGMTKESVQKFIHNFLKQGNFIDLVMDPAQ